MFIVALAPYNFDETSVDFSAYCIYIILNQKNILNNYFNFENKLLIYHDTYKYNLTLVDYIYILKNLKKDKKNLTMFLKI